MHRDCALVHPVEIFIRQIMLALEIKKRTAYESETWIYLLTYLLTYCVVTADRMHIAVILQLCRNDEYVTLRNTRQTHEDETRRHNGGSTYFYWPHCFTYL